MHKVTITRIRIDVTTQFILFKLTKLQRPRKCVSRCLNHRRPRQRNCQLLSNIHGLIVQIERENLQIQIVGNRCQCFGQSKNSQSHADPLKAANLSRASCAVANRPRNSSSDCSSVRISSCRPSAGVSLPIQKTKINLETKTEIPSSAEQQIRTQWHIWSYLGVRTIFNTRSLFTQFQTCIGHFQRSWLVSNSLLNAANFSLDLGQLLSGAILLPNELRFCLFKLKKKVLTWTCQGFPLNKERARSPEKREPKAERSTYFGVCRHFTRVCLIDAFTI